MRIIDGPRPRLTMFEVSMRLIRETFIVLRGVTKKASLDL